MCFVTGGTPSTSGAPHTSGGVKALTGDVSGKVVVWDIGSQLPIVRLQTQSSVPLLFVSMREDGRRALTLDVEGNAHLW